MGNIHLVAAGIAIVLFATFAADVHGQAGTRTDVTVVGSAGAVIIADGRATFGLPPITVLSLGLSVIDTHWEFTAVSGRAIVVPDGGVLYGVESGINVSPRGNGGYGGLVISRVATGDEAIVSLGARIGVRPVRGPGMRMEARADVVPSDDLDLFLAWFSIGYDFGRRNQP